MTSYILVFAAQEIYAACVMIWNVLPPSRPPTVFRFSADQINVFVRCTFFGSRSPSAVHRRPLVLDYAPSLSGVSQLLSVCFPADSLFRLQRGATPVAACLQAPAELCKAVAAAPHTFGNRLSVFPDCQNHHRPVKAFTRPTSCSHPGISACRANDTPTIERIINAFVPRKAFCSSALMQTLEQVSGRSPHRLKRDFR